VVVAVPLRIAEESVQFEPGLPAEHTRLMASTPTWMAAQAKAVILYEHAFWRDAGLSGRIASQRGPLVEVHDHSGADGSPAALFGFIGLPFAARERYRDALPAAVIDQLMRCFGDSAPRPDTVVIEDWALNPLICSQRDLDCSGQHPGSMSDRIRTGIWHNRLYFAVAETSAASPGLIDGALDAGTCAASAIVAAY
jgi:monoamine oxidase